MIFSVIKEGSEGGGGGAFIPVKHCDRIANGQFVDGRRLLFVLSLLVVMFEGPFLSECNRTVQT